MTTASRPSLRRPLRAANARELSFGLAFLGLAAVVAGCFVPIADAGSVDFDRIDGNSLRFSGIGWLTLVLCGMLTITLARSLHRGQPTWGPIIGGLLLVTEAVYVGAAELTTCSLGASIVDTSTCQTAAPGLGLFMIGAGGAALAVAGLELAPWRQPRAGSLVVIGATAGAALPDHRASPTGPARSAAEQAATLASSESPELVSQASPDLATHVPAAPGPDPDTEHVPVGDVGSRVAAVLVAAEEAARQIVADARAEAARITSRAEWLGQASAESQRRLDEEVAKLLGVCRAVEDELVRALSMVTGSPADPSPVAPSPPAPPTAVGQSEH